MEKHIRSLMLSKDNITSSDFEKEVLYHLSEIRYHEEKYQAALKEAAHHVDRVYHHEASLLELNAGVLHA